VGVERRPIDGPLAGAAGPWAVAAAVAEAGLMPYEDQVRAETVPVGAVAGRVGNPLPGRGLYQLAQHDRSLIATEGRAASLSAVQKGNCRTPAVLAEMIHP
jgi:hypothetical protein